jgi:hypothetical protein
MLPQGALGLQVLRGRAVGLAARRARSGAVGGRPGGLGPQLLDALQLGGDLGELPGPGSGVADGLVGVGQTTNRRAAPPWPRVTSLTRRLSPTVR